MNIQELQAVAHALVAPGKGLLASDESVHTLEKHFDEHGIEKTDENRRAYRELLFTAPGAANYISGAIFFEETLRQSTSDGRSFVSVLREQGIIPGIKVDLGTEPLPGAPGELTVKGIDTLAARLVEYYALGARFAKWRAVFTISATTPSELAIKTNVTLLAEYARLCQVAQIVPIVEPEVLMDGDHTIEQCYEATVKVQTALFVALRAMGVDLSALLLKPNMILAGQANGTAKPEVVAEQTVRCLKTTVPAEVPGIVFLSGGQADDEAVANLQAIAVAGANAPWKLTYSYGRALQTAALATWAGKAENVAAAQAAYVEQARRCSLASQGAL